MKRSYVPSVDRLEDRCVPTGTTTPAAQSFTPGTVNCASITINGSNFDPTAANNVIAFNLGATGTVTAATSTQLTVTVYIPINAAGNLTAVVTTDGASNAAPVQVATVLAATDTDSAVIDIPLNNPNTPITPTPQTNPTNPNILDYWSFYGYDAIPLIPPVSTPLLF